MLGLLLNHATLIIAVALFLSLLVFLFFKRKQLQKTQKIMIGFLGAILLSYFAFVGFLTFEFGNSHPSGEPSPQSIDIKQD